MQGQKKSFGPYFLTYMLEDEPQTFKGALNSIEGLLRKEAIKSEIDSILQNHIYLGTSGSSTRL